jgi:hypothetical protein
LWERNSGFNGTLEQTWFAGMHSNVGGSSTPDGVGTFSVATNGESVMLTKEFYPGFAITR